MSFSSGNEVYCVKLNVKNPIFTFYYMRKYLILCFFTAFAMFSQTAKAQYWNWAKGADSTKAYMLSSGSEGWPVTTDSAGNVYVALCQDNDTMSLGTYTFHGSLYKKQIILAKYDAMGLVQWASGSAYGNCWPIDITSDASGNVYLYGYFVGDSMRIGSAVFTGSGATSSTAFIIKYKPDGSIGWKTKAGSIAAGYDKMSFGGITCDAAGNVYIAGTYSISNLQIGSYSVGNGGNTDVYVAKFNSNGNVTWLRKYGGTGYERASSINVSKDGSLYLAGEFSSPTLAMGATNLTFSSTTASSTASAFNVFVSKLTTDGTLVWSRQSRGDSRVMKLVTDSASNIYIGGMLVDSSVTFNSTNFPSNKYDPYYVEYDATGAVIASHVFAHTFTPSEPAYAIWGMTIDRCNNLWVSGGLDTATGNGILLDTAFIMPAPQNSIAPMFMACYRPDGSLLDYLSLASGGKENSGLAAGSLGQVYVCGTYQPVDTFVIGMDTLHTAANVTESFFVARYQPGYSCISSAVNDTKVITNVVIYPNPTGAELYVSSPTIIESLEVIDLNGRVVYRASPKTMTASVKMSDYVAGLYVIRINHTEVQKFLKQ